MPRKKKSSPKTMPQTPRQARSTTRKRKGGPVERSSSPPPRRPRRNRPLKDAEIYQNVDMRRGPFLLSLARELVLPEMKLRVYNDRIPRELRLTIERIIGPTDMPEPPPSLRSQANQEPGTRKTCAICPSRLKRRTKYYCQQCKKPMCLTCCLQICNDCVLRR